MNEENNFLGRGWSFPPRFDKTIVGIEMVEAERDIKQSLLILLNTNIGERIMRPEYGCNLRSFVFQSVDTSKVHFIQDIISNAILKYEPRITVNEIMIDTQNYLDGLVVIDISFTIKTTNTRNNIVFPFYLTEGTLVNV